MAVRAGVCKLCGQPFEVEIGKAGGRPREYCFDCCPEGFKIVKVPGQTRLKLRRVKPLMRRSDVWSARGLARSA